jgi:hypothetical protein
MNNTRFFFGLVVLLLASGGISARAEEDVNAKCLSQFVELGTYPDDIQVGAMPLPTPIALDIVAHPYKRALIAMTPAGIQIIDEKASTTVNGHSCEHPKWNLGEFLTKKFERGAQDIVSLSRGNSARQDAAKKLTPRFLRALNTCASVYPAVASAVGAINSDLGAVNPSEIKKAPATK